MPGGLISSICDPPRNDSDVQEKRKTRCSNRDDDQKRLKRFLSYRTKGLPVSMAEKFELVPHFSLDFLWREV